MASTIKITNRSPKQPIKNLPSSLEISSTTTFEDLKKIIAKQTGISDFNRIGIFNPTTKKTFKDRKALVLSDPVVTSAGEVLIKDLGLQLDWRTVYLIEYIGPLAMHAAFIAARPYIYKNGSTDMSSSQWLAFYMTMAHYIKREIECIFVHKFSANTMPARNIFKNCGHYWILSGLLCGYFVYSPASLSAKANPPSIDLVGLAIFLFGEVFNAMIHLYFASLRTSGGTERQVPVGFSFDLVTCPNYMYEIIAWTGVLVVTRSWAVAVFMGAGIWQMWTWGKGKERAYRTEFGDRYKKKRYMVLPGLL